MTLMNENELNFEMIEALLRYIGELNEPGSILVFLPGWNLIFMLLRHLEQHPIFGQSTVTFSSTFSVRSGDSTVRLPLFQVLLAIVCCRCTHRFHAKTSDECSIRCHQVSLKYAQAQQNISFTLL